jgi:hypothetical protein
LDKVNWDAVSAIANVVVALTAVIAASYAFLQHLHALRAKEYSDLLDLFKSSQALQSRLPKDNFDEHQVEEILNHLEVYERLISERLLSRRARDFYREFITIGDVENIPFREIVRILLKGDQKGYRHLIAAFKDQDENHPFIQWGVD